ncbi:MAG: TlpA disulfide reductase family protein [Myxococcota bacterium]|nr:TlpA disulfide reductase family protein [Myxococcota bacterium]
MSQTAKAINIMSRAKLLKAPNRSTGNSPSIIFLVGIMAVACQCRPGSSPQPPSSAPKESRPSTNLGVSQPLQNYYRQVFPDAHRFEIKNIPKKWLSKLDKRNSSYVVVSGMNGEKLGYIRDVVGPISPDKDCPCSPITVSLAFNDKPELVQIFSEAPLKKWGNTAFTQNDLENLHRVVREQTAFFKTISHPNVLIDGISGATLKKYSPRVVGQAALTSWRITRLVDQTQQIIVGVPILNDTQKLETRLRDVTNSTQQMSILTQFLREAESERVGLQAYRRLRQLYRDHLKINRKPRPYIENLLLQPRFSSDTKLVEVLLMCQDFAFAGVAPELVQQCVLDLRPGLPLAFKTTLDTIEALLFFQDSKFQEAHELIQPTLKKSDIFSQPELFGYAMDIAASAGQTESACALAKKLYLAHPRYPKVIEHLNRCVPLTQSLQQKLDETRKARLLQTRIRGATAPSLELTDSSGLNEKTLNLQKTNKVTALVFFATWCPHCQDELPKLIEFQKQLGNKQKEIQLVGVRTAVEREKEPYDEFTKRFELNFDIFTDPVLSLNFSKFTKHFGLTMELPTLVILDQRGALQYQIFRSQYSDLNQELTWLIDSLL